MPQFTLVAWSNPVEGEDEEFGAWYDQTHLRDMLGVPGFKTAQRFRLLKLAPSKLLQQRYLCIYEFEADDEEHAAAVIKRLNAHDLPLSDKIDVSSVALGVYEATGPALVKE